MSLNAIDWEKITKDFVKSLKLDFNSHITQVELKDSIAFVAGDYVKLNNVLIDLSSGYLKYSHCVSFQTKIKRWRSWSFNHAS